MSNRTDDTAFAFSTINWQATVGGTDVPVKAVIREPFEVATDCWICATTICGLFHRKADLSGVSAPAAIAAARRFLKAELEAYVLPDQFPVMRDKESRQRLWRLIDNK